MTKPTIPVVIETRHVRLTAAHVDLLFGTGYVLLPLVPLEFTERFAAAEVVVLRGPTGTLKNVRILGPTVGTTCVFLSDDDRSVLGLCPGGETPPSGETCSIDGPRATIVIAGSDVRRVRRLVTTESFAAASGLATGAIVEVSVHGERDRELRGLAFEMGPALFVGLDVAEANTMEIGPGTRARLTSG